MWPCLGLFALTCLVALVVATLLWLLLRRCAASGRSSRASRPSLPASHTGVHTVTDLPAFLRQHPDAIVLFHASWCSHCKKLLPIYKQAAESGSRVLGSMLCDEAEGIVQQYKLRGFPTILRFHQGQRVEEYRGNRSLEDLQHFCAKK